MSAGPLKIRIRDVAGLKRIDLPLKEITIVAGNNAAGKTSVIQCIAAAATATPLLRGVPNKKSATMLLHNGSEAGSIFLDYGVGSVRISYPDATVERMGQPMEFGSPLALGVVPFMRLAPTERSAQIIQLFKAVPDKANLAAYIAAQKINMPQAALDALWDRIDLNGWDPVVKSTKEHLTKRKGAWEQVTGKRWGNSIAQTWHPANLHPDEEYDLDAAKLEARQAAEALAALQSHIQVDQGRKMQLEQQVEQSEPAAEALAVARAASANLDVRMERIREAIEQHPVLLDTSDLPTCPHCSGRLSITKTRDKEIVVRMAPAVQHPDRILASKQMSEQLEAERQACLDAMEANARAIQDAMAQTAAAENARKELLRIAAAPAVSMERLAEARELNAVQAQKVVDIAKMQEARLIFADWKHYTALLGALEPEGVRRDVMLARIGDANKLLGEMSATARFSAVELDEDMQVTYGGRPYVMLSESEQWRVDLVFAACFNQREAARLFLIDRLDILHPGARPGVIYLAKHLGVPTVIAMTARDRDAAPDLARNKLGCVVWLKAGEIEQAEAASA